MPISPAKTAISDYELLARLIFHPSQFKKNLNKNVMYPRPREDRDRKGYFTNKISMIRVCQGSEGVPGSWSIHTARAVSHMQQTREFKGYLLERAIYFRERNFELEDAPSPENPHHMHLVIPEFCVPYSEEKKGLITEFLTPERRKMLDDLRKGLRFVEFKDGYPVRDEDETQCAVCGSEGMR